MAWIFSKLTNSNFGPMNQHVSIFSPQNETFEKSLKMAESLSKTDLIPDSFKGKPGNILIAMELAQRAGDSPLMIMQNMQIINGNPGFKAQYINAKINDAGYKITYEEGTDGEVKEKKIPNLYCRVIAEKNGQKFIGPRVDIRMAVEEGWYDRKMSKWPNMPEVMLVNRAVTFWAKKFEPGIGLGFPTAEEAEDTPIKNSVIADINADLSPSMAYSSGIEDAELEETQKEDEDDNII